MAKATSSGGYHEDEMGEDSPSEGPTAEKQEYPDASPTLPAMDVDSHPEDSPVANKTEEQVTSESDPRGNH